MQIHEKKKYKPQRMTLGTTADLQLHEQSLVPFQNQSRSMANLLAPLSLYSFLLNLQLSCSWTTLLHTLVGLS